MAVTVLVGAQWGDEGKGKLIDVLARHVQWVVRYQGGNNAGHTVEVNGKKYVLHLVPSGVLYPDKKCVMGNGMVVDPTACLEEVQLLHSQGISLEGRLFISDRAHVVLPTHRLLDEARERLAATDKREIGTTKRGIGPAYADKAARVGLRMKDLLRADAGDLVSNRIREHNRILRAYGAEPVGIDETCDRVMQAVGQLKPYVVDTVVLLNDAVRRGEHILCEGAQGTLLDIDFGTYPYVTSSNATAGGACVGAGLPPRYVDRVIGVLKAYTTRVGEGPFPTELRDAIGNELRSRGNEYGATTGRPRRCGWFDAVIARYAVMVNGIDEWALTKLDVLDTLDPIRICVGYRLRGRELSSLPASAQELVECEPIYEELSGWRTPTTGISTWRDLPEAARGYVRRIEELTGVKVRWLSVGPDRKHTLELPVSFR